MLKRIFLILLIISVAGAVSCKKAKVAVPSSLPAVTAGLGRTLWWVYQDGREEALQSPPSLYFFPKISPDGKKIVVTTAVGRDRDLWILDLAQGTTLRLTSDEGDENQPIWSPDGKRIAFSSTASHEANLDGGIAGIVWKAADGTGEAKFLGSSRGKWVFPYSWRRDGKTIVTNDSTPDFQNMDIGMLSTEGDRRYSPLIKGKFQEVQPQFSPDGRWLAYCSDESGNNQIYVRPFPNVDNGGRWQVSTDRGNSPRWSPDGKKLYYLVGGNVAEALMAVDVETGPTFSHGKPTVLLRGRYLGSMPNNGIPYDPHPDGQRFLIIKQGR
jgi:eukaryotic-like serine/threonine-protein kinase